MNKQGVQKGPRLIKILLGLDVLLLLGVVCAWSVGASLRAAEQTSTPAAAPARAPAAAPTPAAAPSTPPASAPSASPGGHHSASEPTVPEPTATIRDDPTIAPDPQESADNNVSFPNDI